VTLIRRVDESLRVIEEFLADRRTPFASVSFGKDSMLMLWLIRKLASDVPVLWFDGGRFDEWPETYPFVRRVSEEWGIAPIVVRPRLSLVEQWKQYGVPWKRGTKQEAAYTREFCGALDGEAKRRGFDGHFLGMRAAESRTRRLLLFSRGPVYYAKTRGLWCCNPLWRWSTAEVWHVTDREHIPVHPIYTDPRRRRDEIRLGTLAETCFAGGGALSVMRLRHPSLFNELCGEFPELRAHA
jgi:3'-phosphoadenosine 5'-phosphosulfate sulfotransferase (PAPS reductase)/FAD synthetase